MTPTVDPGSTRSIIQSAGRIRRHRPATGVLNTYLIGRPLVAMQGNLLSMPGVETPPVAATSVSKVSLAAFEQRRIRDLLGEMTPDRIDASLMLDGSRSVPLRDKELDLCRKMIDPAAKDSFVGAYAKNLVSRMMLQPSVARSFRRSTARDLVYTRKGEDVSDLKWIMDKAPGRPQSQFLPAEQQGLALAKLTIEGQAFVGDVDIRAFTEYSDMMEDLPPWEVQSLFEIRMPDYRAQDEGVVPKVSYHPFTGLVRCIPEDLFEPFGEGKTS